MELIFLEQMEQLREKMIKTGLQYGLQNDETIKVSRQLDELLNQYTNFEDAEYSSMSVGKNYY